MAPFTNPVFVSILRRSMTRAPTASKSLASNPVVKLQSLLSLSSCSAAFWFHLRMLQVSSTSSVHDNWCTCELRQLSISLLK